MIAASACLIRVIGRFSRNIPQKSCSHWPRSLISTTDHTGTVTSRYAYDPFGKRRYSNGNVDAAGNVVADWSPTSNAGTKNGFTGEEQLDDVGVVQMNGRLFDPMLGLFMQPNPSINNAANLQSFNRYSYCDNNPLTCSDPTGLSAVQPFVSASAIKLAMRNGAMVQGGGYIYTASISLAFAGAARAITPMMCGGVSCAGLAMTNQVEYTAAQIAAFQAYGESLGKQQFQRQEAARQEQIDWARNYSEQQGINEKMAYGLDLSAKERAKEDAKRAAELTQLLRPYVEKYFKGRDTGSAEGFILWMNAGMPELAQNAQGKSGGEDQIVGGSEQYGMVKVSIANSRQKVPFTTDSGSPVLDIKGKPMMRPSDVDPGNMVAWGETLGPVAGALALQNFRIGGDWDWQRVCPNKTSVGAFIDFANVCIGLFAAGAGIPESTTLAAANYYAANNSNFGSNWIPDKQYPNLRVENVYDMQLGYQLYRTGAIASSVPKSDPIIGD